MTDNPFAALLRDVPRYDGYGTFDPDGDVVRLSEVLAALAAAVPARRQSPRADARIEGLEKEHDRIHHRLHSGGRNSDGGCVPSSDKQ